jgi:hypothetical protein
LVGIQTTEERTRITTHTSPRAIELAEAVIPPHINTLDPINEAE